VSDFCFFDQHISLSEFQSSFCNKKVRGGGGGSGDHNAQEFLEEVQQQFSYSANVFFLLSSPAYVSSPSLARAFSRSFSSHGRNSLQNSRIGSTQNSRTKKPWQASVEEGLISPRDSWHVVFAATFMENA